MWVIEVTVHINLEETVDKLAGEAALIYQCWGNQIGERIWLKYAFRDEQYAKEAYERLLRLPEWKEIRIWDDPSIQDTEGPTASLIQRINDGDVEAARKWLETHKTAYLIRDWWYVKFPSGKSRKMPTLEHITHNKALELVRIERTQNEDESRPG